MYGTALHAAARNGHVGAITALVQAGADLHLVSKDGRTPLAVAQLLYANNHKAAAQALMQAGATE